MYGSVSTWFDRFVTRQAVYQGSPAFVGSGLLFLALLFMSPPSFAATDPTLDVMPLPADVRPMPGRLAVTRDFGVAFVGAHDPRIPAAVARVLRRWEERTGLAFRRTGSGEYRFSAEPGEATLVVDCATASSAIPELGADESYMLEIGSKQAALRAPTTLGALRGMETVLQLLHADSGGWFLNQATVRDQPRFPWRGLMIDVSRHWQPLEVIKRNIDGMTLVKLNVLHLHLSDDQGFRVECRSFPRLHELGSDGHYFTQAQLREIVAYAAERGIRVIPEFDVPGHTQSWVVGYPELASAPGPYVIERRWGVFNPVLDPTNEATYTLLEGLVSEMVAIFPDPYFHIGGDENNGVQWSANPGIQAFIREHGLRGNEGLQAYFNRRLQVILEKHGRKLIGWDEILQPELPKAAVIQSWRGPEGLAAAARAGHPVVLSNGYYIDLGQSAAEHYLIDPLPSGAPLSPEERRLVFGGEATMWSEWVSPETIDSRIWPRTAAIAERFWSPANVTDVDDMYRRLASVSRRLAEEGLCHEANREPLVQRYAGDSATPADVAAIRELVALVEPVKGYRRGKFQPDHAQQTPLTGLADCAVPDSQAGREFSRAVDAVIVGRRGVRTLSTFFTAWGDLAARLRAAAPDLGPRSAELMSLAGQLEDAAAAGAEINAEEEANRTPAAQWITARLTRLDVDSVPQAAVELPLVGPLRLLAIGLRERGHRNEFTPEAWLVHLKDLASPKPSS